MIDYDRAAEECMQGSLSTVCCGVCAYCAHATQAMADGERKKG